MPINKITTGIGPVTDNVINQAIDALTSSKVVHNVMDNYVVPVRKRVKKYFYIVIALYLLLVVLLVVIIFLVVKKK